MERLTSNVDYCETYCENNKNSCPIYGSCINRKSYELARSYEDAEEQGLILRLPCKVGDTLYFIYHNTVCHSQAKRFFQCNGAKNWGIVLWDMYPDLYFDQIGKTVFLTKEEAEQALKQMGE